MIHFTGTGFTSTNAASHEGVEVVVQRAGAGLVACLERVVQLGDRARGEVADAARGGRGRRG